MRPRDRLRPLGAGVLEGEPRQHEREEGEYQEHVHDAVLDGEAFHLLEALAAGCDGGGHDPLALHAVMLPVDFPPPQDGVEPEEGQRPDEEPAHQEERGVQGGVLLAVRVIRVRLVAEEPGVEPRMAPPAARLEIVRVDARSRVLLGEDVVPGVAVAAAGHGRRVSQLLDLAVVGALVVGDHPVGEVVALHHDAVRVAAFALLGVKLTGLGRVLLQGSVKHPGVVQAVAVGAGRRILIALHDGLSVA